MCTHVRSLITRANNFFEIVFLQENEEILPYRCRVAMGVILLINMFSTSVLIYEPQLEISINQQRLGPACAYTQSDQSLC